MIKILNILVLIIFIETIFISNCFGDYSLPNRTNPEIETETTFSIQFVYISVPSFSSKGNFDQSCIDRVYNFQLETCIYINDDCIVDSFINVNETTTTTTTTTATTTTTTNENKYQVNIFKKSTNQKPGCKDIFIQPSISLPFSCNGENSNGTWKQFNELNVTCQPNTITNTFYKYSFGKCVNITSQFNKCTYIQNPGCSFNSILFFGDPYTPNVSTFSNGDCHTDGLIDTNKVSCSQNPTYQLNCYDNHSFSSTLITSFSLSSLSILSLSSSFLFILIVLILF
ncbi:hypothetical protein ACTA71_002799 [Dictyostelium dimigraforme]